MKYVNFQELSQDFLNQLVKGAFLTVQQGEHVNTMTIGWGTVGYMWNRPVLMVPVRYSRYTHTLIENATSFTVSLPVTKDLKKELAFCGSKSGRDLDKIKECGLTLEASQSVGVASPIIGECELHIECKIVYKQPMGSEHLSEQIVEAQYKNEDYHVQYYGEIMNAYYK
jgi:Conserved protein/domain typically associated with flavoprotein oxygenases, DIM6/NTAB family